MELCVGEVEKRKLLSWYKAHVGGKAPWTVLGGIRGKLQRISTWEKAHLDLFYKRTLDGLSIFTCWVQLASADHVRGSGAVMLA